MHLPEIIILNGPSSSGKTSIAKELQSLLPKPYFHMQLDAFIDMMPYQNDDLFCDMIYGFHRSIAAMADSGHSVIVDHVLLLPEWLQDLSDQLPSHTKVIAGIYCPLEVLEIRERQRDSRRQGFARSQFDQIHLNRHYDITFLTNMQSAQDCAIQFVQWLKSHPINNQ